MAAARAGNLFQIFTMLPMNTFLWSLGILSMPSVAPRVLLRMPKDHRNVFVGNMVKVWNHFPGLASAKTLSMAKAYIRTTMKKALPV